MLLAGCGSGPGEGGSGGETDRVQYVARADQKCEEATEDLAALEDEAEDPDAIDDAADRLEELAGDLEETGPAEQDAQAIGAIADNLRRLADRLRVLADFRRFGRRPRRARAAARDAQSLLHDVQRRTTAFGFEECEALFEVP